MRNVVAIFLSLAIASCSCQQPTPKGPLSGPSVWAVDLKGHPVSINVKFNKKDVLVGDTAHDLVRKMVISLGAHPARLGEDYDVTIGVDVVTLVDAKGSIECYTAAMVIVFLNESRVLQGSWPCQLGEFTVSKKGKATITSADCNVKAFTHSCEIDGKEALAKAINGAFQWLAPQP
ncbi:MAG: hypothetical protein ABH833_02880 [Parcubacteria group bacterium]